MKFNYLKLSVLSLMFFLWSCDKEARYSDFTSPNNEAYFDETGGDGENYDENSEKYGEYIENPFVKVSDQPVSTFSIDADGGSYSNMRRFFRLGEVPPKSAVRVEEFINYFSFDYEDPTDGEKVAMNYEISSCPWNESHHLLRIGLKGKSIPQNELPPSNFVFLIDVSGSMSTSDKLEILKTGFKRFTDYLGQNDRVAIVTYAGSAGVLLGSTPGDQKSTIKNAINSLGAGGSTAGAEGILTAYRIAEENFIEGGNNRVILGTDGDFNVGPSSDDELYELIQEKRSTGIYLTILGVGTGNLNERMMEQVANKGNGNYEYIDCPAQIEKVFVLEKSKFYTVAKDSKFQITFNGNMVDSYRLIGYENRMLNAEDFENDTVDAGEIGAGQTITAFYELSLYDVLNAEKYASLEFRYKFPDEDQSRLLSMDILETPSNITSASENQRFGAAVTGFGLILRESEYLGNCNRQMIISLAAGARSFDPGGYREECENLMRKLKQ